MFNKLLNRQLQKHFGSIEHIPADLIPVFQAVSQSYDFYEKDRNTIAHSMELSSHEMTELNNKFRNEMTEAKKVSDDLAKINKELDQFAYIVSHDLKAPLRAINNLSLWIEEDLGADITEDIRKNMHMLRGRVGRMEALISGILEYSRVGRQVSNIERLDTTMLVRETVEFLSPPESFTISIQDDMPVIHADKLKMQQVFSNLISNAVKHHHTGNGSVKITCTSADRFYHFSVTDNGPGIDPHYHQKVFDIFQTLQARDKVENTGVGLAIVKKIIEEAGGSIWVESAFGQGSSFTFSVPVPSTVYKEEILNNNFENITEPLKQ